jgi:hypothetical protein
MKEHKTYRMPNQYRIGDLVRIEAGIKHFPIELGMIIEVYDHVDKIRMNDVWEDRWLTQDLFAARGYAYYDVMYNRNGMVEHAVSEIWLEPLPAAAL